MSFSDFKLQEKFIKSIEAAGYQSPTPLQSQLIPLVAEKKSALVWTQSASGKTGAFLIPALNYILENPAPEKRGARVLILTSRRDRVSQINYTIKRLSSEHVIRFGFIVSGRPYQTQMRLMRRPLDVMIATPGRLNDLMDNGKADFSQLEMLIIDDLSSIYKKGLQGLVEKIMDQAGSSCSYLAFVQGDDEIKDYANSIFPDAAQITVEESDDDGEVPTLKTEQHQQKQQQETIKNQQTAVDRQDFMPQVVHVADDYTHKIAMMDHLLDEYADERSVIHVTNSKVAKTLSENLANHGHDAVYIQDLTAEERADAGILIYSDQENELLTDEIVKNTATHIIHFDLPKRTDQYLKRLQQYEQKRDEATLLMVDGYNYHELKHIEKTFGEKLDYKNVPGLEPLKPFVNLSKPSKQKKHTKHSKPKPKNNRRPNKNKTAKKPKNAQANRPSNGNNASADGNPRRQRKGPFGRLNGGANKKSANGTANNRNHRNKRAQPKVGVSSRGTGAPQGGRGWQSDFAEPKERKVESKNVVIRYSKKRSIVNDSDE